MSKKIIPLWKLALSQEMQKAECHHGLPTPVLDHIFRQKWFKMFVPEALGGMGLTLPEGVSLQEELAKIDGTLSWTVTLCSGANWFVGFLKSEEGIQDLSSEKACWGGSGMVGGWAQPKQGGYVLHGNWKYATGSPHLTAFTLNAQMKDEQGESLYVQGQPLIASFFVWPSEVTVKPDWNTVGLKGTASHHFDVKELWVPADRMFKVDVQQSQLKDPIYQVPFQAFAEVTLVANYLGMTQHFLQSIDDEMVFNDLQEHVSTKRLLRDWQLSIQQHKDQFYALVDQLWTETVLGQPLLAQVETELHLTCKVLIQNCYQSIQGLFPVLGMSIVWADRAINTSWLNLMTASQHKIIRDLLTH
jgi:hypothetical protein